MERAEKTNGAACVALRRLRPVQLMPVPRSSVPGGVICRFLRNSALFSRSRAGLLHLFTAKKSEDEEYRHAQSDQDDD